MASLVPREQRRVHETGSCSLTKSGVGHYELAAMFGDPHERERDCLHESRKQNDSHAHTENELTTPCPWASLSLPKPVSRLKQLTSDPNKHLY